MLLALFIIENGDQPDLLFWEINLAAYLCLFFDESIQLIKVILEPILVLKDALVLIFVALFKSWGHTCVRYVIVQLVIANTLCDVHSELPTFLNNDNVFYNVVNAYVKLFFVGLLIKELKIDVGKLIDLFRFFVSVNVKLKIF